MKEYNKLVRDNIPDIIKSNGQTPVTHLATDSEYANALIDKLHEETEEFRASGKIEELADILEVLDAIYALHDINTQHLHQIKQNKNRERGSFSKRIILERVE